MGASCNGSVAAQGVKRDRIARLRDKADYVTKQAQAGRQGALWDLVRQLAAKKAARGPRPVAVLRTADGRIIADCVGLFAAEFSGHAHTVAVEEARQEVGELLTKFSLEAVDRSEHERVAALVDALASCKSGRAVGPDVAPVEFVRSAGMGCLRLLSQLHSSATSSGVP